MRRLLASLAAVFLASTATQAQGPSFLVGTSNTPCRQGGTPDRTSVG
jgi:hypothetical protein